MLRSGASGLRSSWASVARNSSLRRSTSDRSAASVRRLSSSRRRSVTSWLTVANATVRPPASSSAQAPCRPSSGPRRSGSCGTARRSRRGRSRATDGKNSFMILGWSSGKKNSRIWTRRASSIPSSPTISRPARFTKIGDAIQVADADEVRAVLDQRDEPLTLRFGLALPGDVAHDLRRADDAAVVVLDRRDGQRDRDAPAVAAHALGLEVLDPLPGLQAGDDPILLRDALGRDDQRDVTAHRLLGACSRTGAPRRRSSSGSRRPATC